MSSGGAERARSDLQRRLGRLGAVGELARGRLPDELVERVEGVQQRAAQRLGHGTSRTVVALCGATGSGKSSVFNALVGQPVAAVAVTRPTTAATEAATFDEGTAPLLDWLGVDRRHRLVAPDAATASEFSDLVLLDLPDHDSTEASHRAEVERLAEVVDLFVWIVDPQKYADAALHHDFLVRYAGHRGVTMVVLNQVDRLSADERQACLEDLRRLLADDGLRGVRTFAVSASTGEGIDALRQELAARVSEHRAALARLVADVDWVATDLAAAVGDVTPSGVGERERRALADALARAAGADSVARAVAAAHERNAALAGGWPVTRWVRRLRPDPLRRLGLGRGGEPAPGASPVTGDEAASVARTNLPVASGATAAAVGAAVRDLVDGSATGLPGHLRRGVAAAAASRQHDVADALDRTVGTAELPTEAPRSWAVLRLVQAVFATALAVGLLWLAGLFVIAWIRLPDPPTPELGRIPLPTLLAIAGALGGLVVAAFSRRLARRGARRRYRRTMTELSAAAGNVGEELIVGPVEAELRAIAQLSDAVRAIQR
jgi:GTP-binding protein EngB required for normal cell division